MMKHSASLLLFASLPACTVAPPENLPAHAEGEAGECTADAASWLVGQTASAETGLRALALTGAKSLRWGPPRSAFTMDYRADRVNVMYNDSMTITEVTCG